MFDPLAVLLLIAANQSLLRAKGREDQEPVEQPQPAPKPKTAPTPKATQKTENKQPVEKPSRPPKKKVTKSDNGTGFEAKKTDQSRETQLNKNNNRLS